jgi:hypothetical protein
LLLQSALENLSLATSKRLGELELCSSESLGELELCSGSLAPSKRLGELEPCSFKTPSMSAGTDIPIACRCRWPCLPRHCPTLTCHCPRHAGILALIARWHLCPPRAGIIAPVALASAPLQSRGVIAIIALASLSPPLAPLPASCWCLFPCAGILALVALVSAHSRRCDTSLVAELASLPALRWHPR